MFLLITACFLVPLVDAYFDYYFLTEADFLSAQLKFENTDLDCALLGQKQKIAAISCPSYAFQAMGNLIGHYFCLFYQVALPQAKSLILRC